MNQKQWKMDLDVVRRSMINGNREADQLDRETDKVDRG